MVRWSRHSAGRWLVAGALGAWLCISGLLTPAASFATAASRHGSRSCGKSSDAQAVSAVSSSGVSIWLNHRSGPPYGSLVISGSGWPADTAIIIDAYGDDSSDQAVLGQAALVRATTNADGTFQTASFAAPNFQTCGIGANYGEPGQFVLFWAHTSDNQVRAEARFDYVNDVIFSPGDDITGITPGTMIPISGYTWIPDEVVTVTTSLLQVEPNNTSAESSGEAPVHLTSNGQGLFTTEILVPNDLAPPTSFVVGASGVDPAYGTITATPLVFPILPKVAPTLTANLAQGYPGTQVTLRGANWLPGSILAEYCRGQNSENPVELDCNPIVSEGLGFSVVHSGAFTIQVTIPENARPGPITIQVRAQSDILPGIYVVAVPFTVLATWQVVHPRLAQALHIGEVVLPLLLLLGSVFGAVVLWQRRRHVRMGPVR